MVALNESEMIVLKALWNASCGFNGGEGWGIMDEVNAGSIKGKVFSGYMSSLVSKGLVNAYDDDINGEIIPMFGLEDCAEEVLNVKFIK